MSELHFATKTRRKYEPGCSWANLIRAVRRHADAQPPDLGKDLHEWADLLEAIRQLRDD